MNIAVCDDDKQVLKEFDILFSRIDDDTIRYKKFCSAEDLDAYLDNGEINFDLFILDIEMIRMSGIDIAKKIRKIDKNVLISFLTSYSQYVYDVFEVIAFDFIVKPLTQERLNELIKKARNYLQMVKRTFIFSYRKNSYNIPFQKILYLEKEGRKVWINAEDGKKYQCNMTLEEIWKQLDEKMFVSLHKSCIVNIEEIMEIEKDKVILKNNKELYISRDYKKNLKKKHLEFLKVQL